MNRACCGFFKTEKELFLSNIRFVRLNYLPSLCRSYSSSKKCFYGFSLISEIEKNSQGITELLVKIVFKDIYG